MRLGLGSRLKPRERRVVLVGAVVAFLVLGYVYGVEPLVRNRQETRAQLQAARVRVDRSELLLSRRDRLAQEEKDLETKAATLREQILPGPTPTLAAAQLQEIIKAEARRAALGLQRMVVERPVIARIAEIPIRASLKGEIGQVSSFLRGIEQHRLAFSLPELAIQVQDLKSPKELNIDLVVTGYLILPDEGLPNGRPATTGQTREGRAQ